MNKQTITFTASEQTLTKTGGIEHYASNIVSYIEASFTLGDNWAGYDSIRAVWESGHARIATVLDANNKCIVPAEVLTYKSKVNVNLVGSIVENTVLTDRLTTYPILALTVDADARVDSSETTPVTASQFEQFVDVVRDEASAIQNYTYDSEAWAVGQRAGVDVPSTDETYQNNAKYYADQGATLQQEVSDLKSELNATIGFEETTHSIFVPDSTPHAYVTKREFYCDIVPANSFIKTVSVPVANQGGGSKLNAEVWQLEDDGRTLTRVKVVNTAPTSNTTNVIPINYITKKPCYIAIYSYSVQIFNVSSSGKLFYYDSVNNVDATTLLLANLSTTSNHVPAGGYDYNVLTTVFNKEYRLPVKWRQGTMSNGNPYFTMNGCVTDFMIPTAICDKIKVLANTHTMSINYYDYSDGVFSFVNRVAFTADYEIDKTHDYFAINLFKSWSEQTLISQCDNIVGLYVTLPYTDFTKSVINSAYHANPAFNIRDIWSMAHQGYSSDGANHNKKGGYARASARGFTHGECDVKLSSDGVPVCCHDDTFTDATSGEVVTIANKTYAELITYDYYGGTIASLEEIITECKQCGLHLEIDQMSSTNISEVTAIVSKLSAWDICIFAVNYMNEYPDLAPFIANTIKQENANARFLIGLTGFINYENAVEFAKSLGNATFAVGNYTNANLNALKTIASLLSGKARLHIWTVDGMSEIKNALPFINGWTSNSISGDDIFNPAKGSGLKL